MKPLLALDLFDREALESRLAPFRRSGRRIVFTNGCFDLLHPGHVRLLRRARSFGDVLVVGLNGDASVRRLKGSGRPILRLEERAEMLSALEDVDLVAGFDEDTPLDLICRVRPGVLVKGGDWRPDQVVGREEVEGWGGRVEIVPLVAGLSTRELIRRIQGQAGPGS